MIEDSIQDDRVIIIQDLWGYRAARVDAWNSFHDLSEQRFAKLSGAVKDARDLWPGLFQSPTAIRYLPNTSLGVYSN